MTSRAHAGLLAAGAGLLAASLLCAPGASAHGKRPHLAPLRHATSAAAVPGHYIVVLKDGAHASDRTASLRQALSGGGEVTRVYHSALTGYAAELPARALDAVRHDPDVAYVEADQRVEASGTESGAPWGLDRVDQRDRPLNGHYRYDETGAGVTAYIIDTGIRQGHVQFGGRIAGGFSSIQDGRGTGDCNGHGTHVAGIVGSKKYGVAKGVTIRPVRVLNCAGSDNDSKVLAGIDWVTANHTAGQPAVANMSLGGGFSQALDDAVEESIADGVTYAVAAGNESDNACFDSPAATPTALTVGSTTRSDGRSWFSNYGPCVDVFAPGSGIKSTWNTSNTATMTLSGTSMASPHVAGAVALFLQAVPTATPVQVTQALLSTATPGVVTGRGAGSPNRLLFSRIALVWSPSSP